jgi:hypothetical protein
VASGTPPNRDSQDGRLGEAPLRGDAYPRPGGGSSNLERTPGMGTNQGVSRARNKEVDSHRGGGSESATQKHHKATGCVFLEGGASTS